MGESGSALNTMKANLREMMLSIAGNAEHLASASEEIAASATQTARGAKEQQEQVQQVADAMHEMSTVVREVSQNSVHAAASASGAADAARQGGVIVEDAQVQYHRSSEVQHRPDQPVGRGVCGRCQAVRGRVRATVRVGYGSAKDRVSL